MKSLYIRAQTLAIIKANDLEMTGNDLTASASIISDMLSQPDSFVSQPYLEKYEDLSHSESDLAFCDPS